MTYLVRHVRTDTGVRASFDLFAGEHGDYYRGSLVAIGPDDERDLSARLATAFPGAMYGAGSTAAESTAIDHEFGYCRPAVVADGAADTTTATA